MAGVRRRGAPAVTREGEAWRIAWLLAGRERFELEVTQRDGEIGLACRLLGFEAERRLASLGLRFGRVGNVARYLRNGYMSWDGSYFVEPRAARAAAAADPAILSGYAATALVSPQEARPSSGSCGTTASRADCGSTSRTGRWRWRSRR